MTNEFIITKPIITEQSLQSAKDGVYTFEVDIKARKPAIKKAIEGLYKVHVVRMSTIILKGKTKVAGKRRQKITRPDRKKAMIRIAKGEKIDAFEITTA